MAQISLKFIHTFPTDNSPRQPVLINTKAIAEDTPTYHMVHLPFSGSGRVFDQGGQTFFKRAPNFSRSTNRNLS